MTDTSDNNSCDSESFDTNAWPQAGRRRLISPAPVGRIGTGMTNPEAALLKQLDADTVMMMGDNPALPRMPKQPRLLDFFKFRLEGMTRKHLLASAKRALDAGHEEKIVLACLLHDISNGGLIRTDHGYWGAQMIRPYVSEEIAWAVQAHQALRFLPDPEVGYAYPDSYDRFFGEDYAPEPYVLEAAAAARQHHWYMTGRLITVYDTYFFEDMGDIDPEIFTDIIGRNFKEPAQGLGFDNSPTAHMWRTLIWPNNFL